MNAPIRTRTLPPRAARGGAAHLAATVLLAAAWASAPAAQGAAPVEPAAGSEPAGTPSPSAGTHASAAALLPPVRFVGGVIGDDLYLRLKRDARFSRLDRELHGSPVELRVLRRTEMTAGGTAAGLTSAILAGSTLGLLPMVTNEDFVITYEYAVNGTVIASWAYRENFTRSQNMWSTDTTYGLGKEGLEWVKTTAEKFLADSAGDPRLAEWVREHEFYFGPVQAGAGRAQ